MEWEVVIGLEIHAQLATRSKIFSGASTAYGAAPNTQACAVDLGLPGVLPVLNGEVVRMATRFGLATHATVAHHSVFARKNYFYPDLPKGYQISQYELPIVQNGYIDIDLEDGESKRIGVTRAHLEEDAGKSLHEDFHGETGIDLNRAGTPLLEIVTEPDLPDGRTAAAWPRRSWWSRCPRRRKARGARPRARGRTARSRSRRVTSSPPRGNRMGVRSPRTRSSSVWPPRRNRTSR